MSTDVQNISLTINILSKICSHCATNTRETDYVKHDPCVSKILVFRLLFFGTHFVDFSRPIFF